MEKNKTIDKRKVAIYVRVSSQKQLDGYSLDAQTFEIKRNIYSNNLITSESELVEYRDEGSSGKNMHREGIQQLIEDIKNNKIRIVYMWKLDRVSRDISDFNTFLKLLAKYNVKLMSVKSTIDNEKPVGRFMTNIEISMAQLEREQISERTISGLEQSAREGFYPFSSTPYGYKKSEKKIKVPNSRSARKKLEIDDTKASTIKKIFTYATLGYTPREISDELSLVYNISLQPEQVRKMIKDERYKGLFFYRGEYYTNVVPAIIEEKQWDLAQRNIAIKNKNQPQKCNYYFTRKIHCTCGSKLVNTSGKRNGNIYRYYYCEKCRHGINQEFLINQTIHRISTFSKIKDKQIKMEKLQNNLKLLDQKAEKIRIQYINDLIDDKNFIKTLIVIDEKRKKFQAKIKSIGYEDINSFQNLSGIEKYNFIQEHIERINVDVDTKIVVSIKYNEH